MRTQEKDETAASGNVKAGGWPGVVPFPALWPS